MSDDEIGIADLENEIKHRDRRILELKREVDEAQMLITEMREHVQDCSDQTERFIEAFDMVLGDDGSYRWPTVQSQFNELADKHNTLVAQWNRMVLKYNAVVAPKGVGRPLAASEAQQREVRALHKVGKSLRVIAGMTGLGLGTVRTIVGKAEGTDRTTTRTNALRKLELNRANMAAYRARKRTRDALPKQITELVNRGRDLMKRSGVSRVR
jgi:transposase